MPQATASDEANVRELAADILLKVDTRGLYADRLLEQASDTTQLDARDRALLRELTLGTLRWRARLDGYLRPWLRRPLERTDPFLRNLLRLAIYQLVFLDKIPPYAVLDQAVEIAKRRLNVRAGGFVNGVLRNHLRQGQPFSAPDIRRFSIEAVAEYWSHPQWLITEWLSYFDPTEVTSLLEANNLEPPLVLRINRRKSTREAALSLLCAGGIQAEAAPYAPQGLLLQSHSGIAQLPGFAEGLFLVQGEAAQLVAHMLDPRPGERILDTCAAPGGKTTHLAELMDDEGVIDAIDISVSGISRIEQNARRLGLRSIRALQADMTRDLADRLAPSYDRVLVDAPCSGFGTLRAHPEIKWNRTRSDVERLARLQREILRRAAGYVKQDGVLVYSTCTLIERENEMVVEDFILRHSEFVLDEAGRFLPPEADSMVKNHYLLAVPHRHNTDGFFAARLRKIG